MDKFSIKRASKLEVRGAYECEQLFKTLAKIKAGTAVASPDIGVLKAGVFGDYNGLSDIRTSKTDVRRALMKAKDEARVKRANQKSNEGKNGVPATDNTSAK